MSGETYKNLNDGAGGGHGLIGFTLYNPNPSVAVNAASSAYADVDATNLVVNFTIPPSGKVLISLSSGMYLVGGGTELSWGIREATTDIVGGAIAYLATNSQLNLGTTRRYYVSGLTPGAAKAYKWSHARTAGGNTAATYYGTGPGPAIMEVWAVNL